MTAGCRSELLTRVRRGVATEPDRLALDAHLGACASCRMSWVLALDFDAAGAAEPGDAEILARIANAAIGGAVIDLPCEGAPARRRREGAPVRLASAPVRPDNDVRRGDDGARPGTLLAGRRWAGWTRSAWLYAAAAVLVAGVSLAAAALVEPRPAAQLEPSAAASSPGAPPTASTAEQLFREANDARRAGRSRRAIELYRALQRGFASSPEATLSLVSLGGLLLHDGSPAAALAQFDRYLGVAGPRPLAVEALYGRGRALRALGRAGDEAQAWRRLLREHPGSPYVEHARRRLAELGR
ncbi:putative membrane protein [Sorangium cellulosum So ce56]|uniref:Membrane protein n=1 Tax=Sorangium cellulosum (strain So ce56) TaxID=448385 RepID=A9FCB2_SORC5|nr:tetratricopeptide repeat protein [Sorangium cellulosum]CAN91645.1 putative membrane protein [Sorangium cellulosum So ce56]